MAPRRKQAWMGWGAPAMAKVAGWDFDHRLNGYITTAADRFSCDCGEEFSTPSGYRKCGSCGRAWNSYVIGSDSHGKEAALEKVIVREIPVRKDVIVASKRRRTAESDCTCWDGYERVPGTKPCASGSCRKKSARQAGKHDSPFQDMYDQHHVHEDEISHAIPELEPSSYPQEPPRMRREPGPRSEMDRGKHRKSWDPDREQDAFDPRLVGASRRQGVRRYVAWCRQVDRRPSVAGLRRFRTAERLVRLASRHTAGDEPFKDFQYSPGMWQGIHKHYYYPDRIPQIHDYDQFRKDNPNWFNEDGSPNPPPMEDSNPWSMSSRKIAPPMNMSPRSKYLPPNKFDSNDYSNASKSYYPSDVYQRLTPEEIKQHWPEIPQEEWVGYPGSKTPGGTPFRTRTPHEPGRWKYHAPGHETGMPAQPSAMPKKIKPKPVDPSSAESGLMMARRRADRHTLRRIDLRDQEQKPEEEEMTIEHFSSRRRGEIFDITDEGETPKGKGKKSNTPGMRKNPQDWADRRQNGQYTNRWN